MITLVAHCDWSRSADKRWMAVAVQHAGTWMIGEPEPVGTTRDLLERLEARRIARGNILVGFDFPVGLPAVYARRLGLASFRDALDAFGAETWNDWYEPAAFPSEISLGRPFYPMRPGGTRQAHLLQALGVASADDLRRVCERGGPTSRAACVMFWTMGPNQVGKAAIAGWREVIVPNLATARLWPFDGPLSTLAEGSAPILAETYPADVYGRLGLPRQGWSKRRQGSRQQVGGHLRRWLDRNSVASDASVKTAIEAGFGPDKLGEDRFDALIGLLGMIDVVEGRHPEGTPDDHDIRLWEGWILGRTAA